LPAGQMKETFTVKSYRPAIQFFDIRDSQFIPAILRGDRKRALHLAHGILKEKYNQQRSAIDEVVTMATDQDKREEQRAGILVGRRTVALIGLGLGLILVACV